MESTCRIAAQLPEKQLRVSVAVMKYNPERNEWTMKARKWSRISIEKQNAVPVQLYNLWAAAAAALTGNRLGVASAAALDKRK